MAGEPFFRTTEAAGVTRVSGGGQRSSQKPLEISCKNYLKGYFPALYDVPEEDVDFIVHPGDFIYESDAGQFEGFGSYDYPDPELSLPSGYDSVHTLRDYRYLYPPNRTDDSLQEALESQTFIAGRDTTRWSMTATGPRSLVGPGTHSCTRFSQNPSRLR